MAELAGGPDGGQVGHGRPGRHVTARHREEGPDPVDGELFELTIVGTRALVNLIYGGRKVQKLSIGRYRKLKKDEAAMAGIESG